MVQMRTLLKHYSKIIHKPPRQFGIMQEISMEVGPFMTQKKRNSASYACYRVIKWLVRVFYPRITVEGVENLPEEPCLVVGNHTQMHGPIACELYFPGNRYTWCAGQMMHLKDVPAYAFQDFWSGKPKWSHWFYKALSYLIAPLSVCVFNNARTIPVYRDARIITTFKSTVAKLTEGSHVVVFPEHAEPHNDIICDFQDRFIDIAKLYYKRTGKALSFVPMYIAPNLKKMYLGEPVRFDPDVPMDIERERICAYLMDTITRIAVELPRHRVVPYPNIPKKRYPYNRPEEEVSYEKTSG